MQAPGLRVTRKRWIRTPDLAVEFEVPGVILPGDDEASFEPQTVFFLKEADRRARDGDVPWLQTRGRVYRRDAGGTWWLSARSAEQLNESLSRLGIHADVAALMRSMPVWAASA